MKKDEDTIRKSCPHIVVGTPGRILALVRQKILSLKNVKHFVLDECDKMLEQLGKEHLTMGFANRASPLYTEESSWVGRQCKWGQKE